MGQYTLVNPANMRAGQPEDVSVVLANLQAIQTILNGGIDDSNVAVAAGILASKLSGYPNDGAKVLRGDGSWAAALPAAGSITSAMIADGTITGADIAAGTITQDKLVANLRASATQSFTDWNQVTANGWYTSSTAANAPYSTWWLGRVESHDSTPGNSWCTQTLWSFTEATNQVASTYTRRCSPNLNWGPWIRVGLQGHIESAYIAQTVPDSGAVGVWWNFISAGPQGGATPVSCPANMAYFHISGMVQATSPGQTQLVLSNDAGTPTQACTSAAVAFIT